MVLLDFTGVEEASDIKKKLKGGFCFATIIGAVEAVNDKGDKRFVFEYKIGKGQFTGETLKDTVALSPKALPRLMKMYSRIMGVKLDGKREVNCTEFIGRSCMIELEQKATQASTDGQFKAGFQTKIKFAGFFAASDYNPSMDKDLKYCDGYQAKLDEKAGNAGNPDVDVVGEESIPF